MKRHIIIDSDGGVDDLVALFVALKSSEDLTVLGITTIAGKFSAKEAQKKVKKVCEHLGRIDISVFAGCPRPFFPAPIKEELPPTTERSTPHGVDFLIQSLLHAPQKITLVTLGPLTNIALAIIREPRIRQHIEEIVVVGGALIEGDATPAAEYNFYTDPHATAVFLSSNVPLTLLTLERTSSPLLNRGITDFLGEKVETPLNALYGIMYLLVPSFFQHPRFLSVEVDTSESSLKGRSSIDWWGKLDKTPHATLFESVDVQGIEAYLKEKKVL